jgi:hypothetical protein
VLPGTDEPTEATMTTRRGLQLILTMMVLLFISCTTHLDVRPVPPKPNPHTADAAEGMVYFLPYVEYEVELGRELRACRARPSRPMLEWWLKDEAANFRSLEAAIQNLISSAPIPHQDFEERLTNNLDRDTRNVLQFRILQEASIAADGKVHLSEEGFKVLMRKLIARAIVDGSEGYETLWPESFGQARREIGSATDYEKALKVLDKMRADLHQAVGGNVYHVDFQLEVDHAVQVKPHLLSDYDHGYFIAYEATTERTKDTELKVRNYPNGSLKSINATIDDQTDQVIASVLRGALRTASLLDGGFVFQAASTAVSGVQPQGAAGVPARAPLTLREFADKKHELCKPSVVGMLNERSELQEKVEPTAREIQSLNRLIDSEQKELSEHKGQLTTTKATLESLKKENPADPRLPELEKKAKELDAKFKALEGVLKGHQSAKKQLEASSQSIQKALASLREKLTVATRHTFRPSTKCIKKDSTCSLEETRQEEIGGATKIAETWFVEAQLKEYCKANGDGCYQSSQSDPLVPTVLRSYVAAYLPPGASSLASTKDNLNTKGNLVYREPARGELLVCKETACLDTTNNVSSLAEDVVFSDFVEIPQLGAIATLPLRNRTFENNALVAQFRETGALEYLEYKSNARAKKAAKLFEESTETIGQFAQQKREATKNQLELRKAEVEAETKLVEQELELEKKRRELEAFRRGELAATSDESDASSESGDEDGGEE